MKYEPQMYTKVERKSSDGGLAFDLDMYSVRCGRLYTTSNTKVCERSVQGRANCPTCMWACGCVVPVVSDL